MIWDSQQEYTGILVFLVWKCSIWIWDVCFLGMYCIERQGIHHPQLCGSEGAKSNTSPFDPWVQWCATSSLGTLWSVSTPNRYQGTLVPWFFFFFTHASSFVLCVGFSIFSSFERSRRVIIASQWGRWFFFPDYGVERSVPLDGLAAHEIDVKLEELVNLGIPER